MLFKEVA